ncbi:MAG TPA: DedA family protein [Pseudorhizobium sp.]|jgi:membrane protein DedA with SNARE-associated domain|nr:DedA family protein [Pseudorhizobium sp.]
MEAFVQNMMETLGPLGITLLMFLENVFPPIPSELIMPLAGYHATQGEMSIITVVIAGTAGSLLGVLPWYYAGRKFGEGRLKRLAEHHGRWLTMSPSDIESANKKFRRHGNLSVLLGRLIPTVRTLISIPAGIARMPFLTFLIYSAIGTFAWASALALAGYALGQAYETVSEYVNPVSTLVFVMIVLFYVYRVATFKS